MNGRAWEMPRLCGSEDSQIAQQRNDADDDHDELHDLSRAAVDRKALDQIKHQKDDEEGDQNTDEYRHELFLSKLNRPSRAVTQEW